MSRSPKSNRSGGRDWFWKVAGGVVCLLISASSCYWVVHELREPVTRTHEATAAFTVAAMSTTLGLYLLLPRRESAAYTVLFHVLILLCGMGGLLYGLTTLSSPGLITTTGVNWQNNTTGEVIADSLFLVGGASLVVVGVVASALVRLRRSLVSQDPSRRSRRHNPRKHSKRG